MGRIFGLKARTSAGLWLHARLCLLLVSCCFNGFRDLPDRWRVNNKVVLYPSGRPERLECVLENHGVPYFYFHNCALGDPAPTSESIFRALERNCHPGQLRKLVAIEGIVSF